MKLNEIIQANPNPDHISNRNPSEMQFGAVGELNCNCIYQYITINMTILYRNPILEPYLTSIYIYLAI